jgi:hypothetical protein
MMLRSNYEPGTSRWAIRRAQWLALGLSDADMLKPKIAVVNTSSQLAICFSHLDEIARRAIPVAGTSGGTRVVPREAESERVRVYPAPVRDHRYAVSAGRRGVRGIVPAGRHSCAWRPIRWRLLPSGARHTLRRRGD